MKNIREIAGLILLTFWFVVSCSGDHHTSYSLTSPSGINEVVFELYDGVPSYKVNHAGIDVIQSSQLGIRLENRGGFYEGLRVVSVERSNKDEIWEQPWGEERIIHNSFNQLALILETATQPVQRMKIIFRAFDNGIAFRYEFPEQEALQYFEIMDELTEFRFAGDHSAWWIPAYHWNRYEYLYTNSPLSKIDTVHTPVTFETDNGLYIAIHEAALTDYASMTLLPTDTTTLECDLVPWGDGTKVKATAPHVSPWRMIMIGETAGDLITNYMALNLNEPSRIEDPSWIQPGKYVGIWWGMHIGTYTWFMGDRHGATTDNVKRYIDFAAEHGFKGVLAEGWNPGWDGPWYENGNVFSFVESYPDFDLPEIGTYARQKGVDLIGHHETSAFIDNYEAQLEDAFDLYVDNGVKTIKTGYVGHGQNIEHMEDGKIAPHKEWHHGQYMVRHYRKVVELAARYGIMLNVHEPIKDTGIRRTWPNMMSREGARGQEYNAWSEDGGNPPDYTTIIPFTRCLAGPFDFTPGTFDLHFEKADKPFNRVNTTLMKQLALYVTIYSPLQMASDLPENYSGHPAFQFIEDVPADWETTRVLNGKIGDFITVARKDRNSDDWYIGSITDEEERLFTITLDFLDSDREYLAQIYADSPQADWQTNPYAHTITEKEVNSQTELEIMLAAGGGQAIRLYPVK